MIATPAVLAAPREAGVVYTRPWMVELVLDLAGYLPEREWGRSSHLTFRP